MAHPRCSRCWAPAFICGVAATDWNVKGSSFCPKVSCKRPTCEERVTAPCSPSQGSWHHGPRVQPCCRRCHLWHLAALWSLPGQAWSWEGMAGPSIAAGVWGFLGCQGKCSGTCARLVLSNTLPQREGKSVGKKQAAQPLSLVAACFCLLWKWWNYAAASSVCVPGVMEPVSGGSFFVLQINHFLVVLCESS